MIIELDLSDLIISLLSAGGLVFAALWALLHRMVFRPLDNIASELKDMKEVFGPRIAVLESQVIQLMEE